MKRKISLLLTIIVIGVVSVFANDPLTSGEKGTLKGKLYDKKSKAPLEYATVAVYKAENDSVVTGTVTNMDGSFKISPLDPGNFYIVISFLGYDEKRFDDIEIKKGRDIVDLGDIILNSSSSSLDEIEVVADRNAVEYKIDKKVVSVGEQMSSASLTAVEVLENVPSIRVDIEGNVSLRGSTGFTVLIDGKPTVLEPSDALRQMPASTIQNIEIITNPSAKYQPDGTGGIINIITKKNRTPGVQGLVNLKAGRYGQYGGDFLLNWRKNKTNFYVGGDYNTRPFPGESYSERRTFNEGITSIQKSQGESERSFDGGSLRAGFDWDITDNDFFSIGLRTGKYDRSGSSSLDYVTYTSEDDTENIESNESSSSRNGTYYSLTGNYQKKFNDEGHELAAQLNYRYREGEEWNENLLYSDNSSLADEGTYTTEDGPSGRWELRLDYTKPIGNNSELEAGFQGRISDSDDITSLSIFDPNQNEFQLQADKGNAINYKRNIYALYSTYKGEISKLGYQLGLRGELTKRDIVNSVNNDKLNISRWDYFPTLHLSYQLPMDNQLMASYSRRIDRPRGYYLEPFITYEDMYNVRMGDPNIDPEYIDAMEFGYLKQWENTQLSFEGYYRITHNKIERIKSVYEEDVLLTTIANVGSDYSLGLDASINTPITKWWELNLMGNIYDYRVEGELNGENFDRTSFNWSSRLNSTFKIIRTLRLQVDGNYNSPSVTSQGKNKGYYRINSALRADFFDRKFSAVVQVRDIFDTGRHEFETRGEDFYNYQKWESNAPFVSFTLSYRINNFIQKKKGEGGEGGGMDDDGF